MCTCSLSPAPRSWADTGVWTPGNTSSYGAPGGSGSEGPTPGFRSGREVAPQARGVCLAFSPCPAPPAHTRCASLSLILNPSSRGADPVLRGRSWRSQRVCLFSRRSPRRCQPRGPGLCRAPGGRGHLSLPGGGQACSCAPQHGTHAGHPPPHPVPGPCSGEGALGRVYVSMMSRCAREDPGCRRRQPRSRGWWVGGGGCEPLSR